MNKRSHHYLIYGQRAMFVRRDRTLSSSDIAAAEQRHESDSKPRNIFSHISFFLFRITLNGSAFGKFHKISFDEVVYIAIHHSANIGGLIICAMILDSSVVEHITADL